MIGTGVAVALLALACSDTFDPLPVGAIPLDAPAVYQLWWGDVRACSGGTRTLSSVTWYVVPGVSSFSTNGQQAGAAFFGDTRRIVVAGDLVYSGPVVRHEILHALFPTLTGHPREQFLHHCGDVVACDAIGCRDEAGDLIPLEPTTVVVPPESLWISASTNPTIPALSAFSGRMSIIVQVYNPAAHSVLVTLPSSGGPEPSMGFAVQLEGSGLVFSDARRIYDDGARFFRAGETKWAVFDYTIGLTSDGGRIVPGAALARASFGPLAAAQLNFTIAP